MQKPNKKTDQGVPTRDNNNSVDFYSPNIPKSFQLGGLKIDVRFQKKLAEKVRMLGLADYLSQEIRIDPTRLVMQTVEQVFFHELTHWILFVMGEMELCNNEKFVDVFAHFLYQTIATAEPYPQPLAESDDFSSQEKTCDDIKTIERLDFMEERECEPSDFVDSCEYQQSIDEAELEEEHYRACQEAGGEDVVLYQKGMALSEDEGWFYDDES